MIHLKVFFLSLDQVSQLLQSGKNADALKAAYPFADGQEAQETMAALLSETEIFRPRIEALDRGN